MSGYLFDTHVWLWLQRSQLHEFSSGFPTEVEEWQRKGQIHLSPISVWEVARLSAEGLIDLGTSVDRFVETATIDGGLQMTALSPRVLIESTRLPGDLHRDPADRILAATARELGMILVTRDKLLIEYGRKGHLRVRKP